MTFENLTNSPVTLFGQTLAPRGWQPLPPPREGIVLIVDVYEASAGWHPARPDLMVVSEIMADSGDRTAVILAHSCFIVKGNYAVRRQQRILLAPDTREHLLLLQDDAPATP